MDSKQMLIFTDLPILPECDVTSKWSGYVAVCVSVVCYGVVLLPLKKYNTGDGIFFQWMFWTGVFIVGFALEIIRDHPPFYNLVMIGGLFRAGAYVVVVPVVKAIGMSQSMCIWSMSHMIGGWFTGRYGLFGLKPEVPDNNEFNIAAVVLAILSTIIFSCIKAEGTRDQITTLDTSEYQTIAESETTSIQQPANVKTVIARRFLGVAMSIVAGLLFSQTFTPTIYIQDHPEIYTNASQNGLDYVFACTCGMYLTSTAIFLTYTLLKRNHPDVYPEVILPAIIAGLLWGIATTLFFYVNRILSVPVAFPIIVTSPPVITSLLGVIIYKEIKGTRNLFLLLFGVCTTVGGATLSALSKSSSPSCDQN